MQDSNNLETRTIKYILYCWKEEKACRRNRQKRGTEEQENSRCLLSREGTGHYCVMQDDKEER